jgi:acetyl-CoA C-acetyltransferase
MLDNTPILVGAGQYVARSPLEPADMLSPVAIAATAAQRALADAHSARALAAEVDTLAVVRLFEHSVADRTMWPNPFGSTNNVPWSVARRLGLAPRRAIYAEVGGQSPQRLVNTLAERIHAGEIRLALVTGAEAIATIREATRRGIELDWREEATGEFEDRWPGKAFVTAYEQRHGIAWPIHVYALFEQVRRHRRRQTLATCRAEIARLFANFSAVAAAHPYAQFPIARDSDFLHTVSNDNYLLCEPYTRWMVAQDAVNQGAAVLLTSVATARELGIPEARWVYLHGYGDVDERTVLERPDLAASPAQYLATAKALEASGIDIAQVAYLDFYSCFPIAVTSLAERLGLPIDGSRTLTLTGGLPFFGGPGNNYSMHAIATLVERLRADRDAFGLIVANGGYLSKHSAGVYGGRAPGAWAAVSSGTAQREADAGPTVRIDERARGPAQIESYAAIYSKGTPADGFVVARLAADDSRCMARVARDDAASLASLFAEEVIGRPITVEAIGEHHTFRIAPAPV